MRVLVTGGAGFVGSHTVDALVERGLDVRVFDSLEPQVHGAGGTPPTYLHPRAEFRRGDVRDRAALRDALDGVDAVLHLAAAVGVGQSMYEIRRYVDANALGGATLLDILANEKHTVRKLVVASSMSIYGEGAYHCSRCGDQDPRLRSEAQLRRHEWETTCPRCGERMTPRPTTEDKRLFPTSIYAVTKRDHEEMFLCVGRAYGIPTVALRYFNIYGPRQALSNPYTGVVAIFASRILNGHPPLVFEDGLQTRDFVHVSDIVRANVMALESEKAADQVFNVGTGRATSMLDLARHLSDALGYSGKPEIVNRYRAGDIRHCYADIGSIRTTLGFEPGVTIEDGLRGLTGWLRGESARDDVEKAREEMAQRGLLA